MAPDDFALDLANLALLSSLLSVSGVSPDVDSSKEATGVTNTGSPPGGVGATICGIVPKLDFLSRPCVWGAVKLASEDTSAFCSTFCPNFDLYLGSGLDLGRRPDVRSTDFDALLEDSFRKEDKDGEWCWDDTG